MAYSKRDLELRFKKYKDLITVKQAQEMINMSEAPIFKMLHSDIIYSFKYHKYNYISKETFINYLVSEECQHRWGDLTSKIFGKK